MTLTLVDALRALRPNDSFMVRGEIVYENIQLADKNKTLPTESEIEQKLAELQYQEEVNVYQEKRKLEYPDWGDQLDKIYHSGIDAWKADIKVIKDKYPKQTMDTAELQKRKDAVIFKLQKRDYEKATARLAQHELANGVVHPRNGTYIVEPLPIWIDGERNPKVVQDEAERVAAQEVINKTPQAVIDSINT
jgi:hypothetical protein